MNGPLFVFLWLLVLVLTAQAQVTTRVPTPTSANPPTSCVPGRLYSNAALSPARLWEGNSAGGCTRVDAGAASSATIPSVTNLIKGDGAGNGADSGIVPANVPLLNGTTAFSATQTISKNAATIPAGETGTLLNLGSADGTASRVQATGFAAQGFFSARRANGTAASPTNLVNNDQIGAFNFGGYMATGYSGVQASLGGFASGTWTDTSNPTYLLFRTTPAASTTLTTALTLASDQSATFANTVNATTFVGALTGHSSLDLALTGGTLSGGLTMNGAAITLSGTQSVTYGTAGIRIKGVAATFNDPLSSGTVAAAYTDTLGGNTLTATGATTITDYNTLNIQPATASTNITITRKHSVGILDSTSASSSITGGLVVAAAYGTSATSVGIGGGIVSAGTAFRGADGSASAPTYSFTANTNSGLYNTGGAPTLTVVGVDKALWGSTEYRMPSAYALGWVSSTSVGSTNDTVIERGGASGVVLLGNAVSSTGFTRLQFGLTTNSAPAIGSDAVNGFTLQSAAGTATWNDASTASSGTVANRYLFGIAAPTLTATNTTVTNTVASTFYIGGAPTDSTNTTSTTKWALLVAAGNVSLSGSAPKLSDAGFTTCTALTTASNILTCTVSDKTVKQDFKVFSGGLDFIRSVTPQTYSFRAGTQYYDGGRVRLGLVAQEVQPYLPNAVIPIGNGLLQIDYNAVTVASLSAIKELDTEVRALRKEITALKALPLFQAPVFRKGIVSSLTQVRDASGTVISISFTVLILDNNSPEQRSMNYTLMPAEFAALPVGAAAKKAQLVALIKREVHKSFNAWTAEIAVKPQPTVPRDPNTDLGITEITDFIGEAP